MKLKNFLALAIILVLASCSANDRTANTEMGRMMAAPEMADSEDVYMMDMLEPPILSLDPSSETHLEIIENDWVNPQDESAISFTLQIDTASYGNISRMINDGYKPPVDAVRIAEMLNYFNFEVSAPFVDDSPFSVYAEIGRSPFNPENHLAFVRVKTKEIDRSELPPSNLTFLVDTSGSMSPPNRLPLFQQAMALLVENLNENDVVSIVTYAGSSEIVLDSVPGNRRDEIINAVNNFWASGSTAGAQGILTAYELVRKNFNPNMNNRIILATDGDFNVGLSSVSEITDLMNEERRRGVYMTLLGFGHGNFRDDMMETIAANGNANYHYINNLQDARKVFVEELISNLFVIAEETRAQIEFNPNLVNGYRLIGYENRIMDNRDFENDFRDAGEIGVGSEIVLMFELDLSDYASESEPLFEIRIRYKEPGEFESRLITLPVNRENVLRTNTQDFNFAAAVAVFGHILRDSEHIGAANINTAMDLAVNNLGSDRGGHRRTFVRLLETFQDID